MTINSEKYQKLVENQTMLFAADRESYNRAPLTKLWKSIMRGDIDKVKQILLNSQTSSQSSNHSEQQQQSQINTDTVSNSSYQIIKTRLGSYSQDRDIGSFESQCQKYRFLQERHQSFSLSENNDQQIINRDHDGPSLSQHHLNLHQYSNSAVNLYQQDQSQLQPPLSQTPLIEQPLNKYGWTALHTACYYGHLPIVQYLIESCEADVNHVNLNGWHSLIFAVFGGHLDVIDYLLYETSINEDLEDASHNTALVIAEKIGDSEVIELLQEIFDQKNNHSSNCFSSNENIGSGKFNQSYESLLKSLEEY